MSHTDEQRTALPRVIERWLEAEQRCRHTIPPAMARALELLERGHD